MVNNESYNIFNKLFTNNENNVNQTQNSINNNQTQNSINNMNYPNRNYDYNNQIPNSINNMNNPNNTNSIYNNTNYNNDDAINILSNQSPIYRSSIPAGQEDLYILKSQVVPPVCPQCPSVEVNESILKEKCPPCPPCARCPEPNFDCKKVPNYSLGNQNKFLPMPILNDFSTFGS